MTVLNRSGQKGKAPFQEASVSWVKRRVPDLRRCSITWVDSSVSMALELATARTMRLRETTTLPAVFLRTIYRTRAQMNCSNCNTTASSRRIGYRQYHGPGSGNSRNMNWYQTVRKGGLLWMQRAEYKWLEAEIKRNLGGLGYEF